MLKRMAISLVFSTTLAFGAAAQAQDNAQEKQPNDAQQKQTQPLIAKASTGGSISKAATSDPNYVIGAEDVLDINVWKETELTRSVPVRPDGKISLPLLNDVQAAGLTPMQLSSQIADNLNKYVTNPQVTVIVTAINSQRIYIIGEVARAGAFPLTPGMTVLQALANAGGFSQYANKKGIYVRRMENGKPQKFAFNYKEVIAGNHLQQDIELKPGDEVVVP